MCQHLKELHYSVDQYFPNDQCVILQNHGWWVKVPLKIQDPPMDFHVAVYVKFAAMVPHSTVQLTLKELPLAEFWGIQEGYLHYSSSSSFSPFTQLWGTSEANVVTTNWGPRYLDFTLRDRSKGAQRYSFLEAANCTIGKQTKVLDRCFNQGKKSVHLDGESRMIYTSG